MGSERTVPNSMIQEQLQRILVSPGFVHSERLRRFLNHCVNATLEGRIEDLKEYTIGITAFDRSKDYDPTNDPIVRVEARRLRTKLDEYYRNSGASDPVLIQIPKGAYLPEFARRASPRNRYRQVAWAAAVVLVLAAVAWWIEAKRLPPPEMTLTRVTFDRGLTTDPALSPDGATLVYASDRANRGGMDIWIQPLSQSSAGTGARQLTSDEFDDSQPAISPDGTLIAFRSERHPPGIYVIPKTGGQPKLLAPDGRNPQFSPDGRSVAYWTGAPGGDFLPPAGKLYVIPSNGGTARAIAANFVSATCPTWSPNGRRLLVQAIAKPGDDMDLWLIGLEGEAEGTGIVRALDQAKLKLSARECSFAWRNNDAIVFSASGGETQNVWQLPVTRDARPAGRPAHLTIGSAEEIRPSASASGPVAFVSRTQTLNVWRMPAEDSSALSSVTQGTAAITFPDAGAGDRLAFLAMKGGRSDLWLKDLHSGTEMQITSDPAAPRYPQVCPDGRTVIYSDGPNTYAATDRAPGSRLLCNGCARVWQCNRQEILYLPAGATHPNPVYRYPLPNGPGTPLLVDARYDLAGAQESDDGWIAFHAITGPARRQIFVARYRTGGSIPREDWIPVTDGTNMDRNAVWNDRADRVYFLSERCGFRCIWEQRLNPATKQPVGPPTAVRHFHSARQDLSSIGDAGAIGLSYYRGNLYFTMAEESGNIWLARSAGGR